MRFIEKGLVVGCILTLLACSEQSKKEAESPPTPVSERYTYDWESLRKAPVPDWLEQAKFGIFIHWGPYAVPGWSDEKTYAEWYSTRMYCDSSYRAYHEKTYGPIAEHGYKEFIPKFKGENFDANQWADILKASGAKYVIPTAEHHDGFAMYDSDLTPWNSVDKGPGFDFIGLLGEAVRSKDMKFGCSYHRERHWGFYTDAMNTYKETAEPFDEIKAEIARDPESALLYGPFGLTEDFMKDYKARFLEICTKYQPDFMWIDDAPSNSLYPEAEAVDLFMNTYHKEMIADYMNLADTWGKKVYFNNKKWKRFNYPEGIGVSEKDYLRLNEISDIKWQSSGGMAHSYGYDRTEEDASKYKTVEQLVETLIDVVSKNGNFLLDIGPKPDGTITELQEQRLRGIGEWLSKYGEAIYGTKSWSTFGYENIRFTRKNKALYVICLDNPETAFQVAKTETLSKENVKSVEMIGHAGESPAWTFDDQALTITPPENYKKDHAVVFKVILINE